MSLANTSELEHAIRHDFSNKELLTQALTHSSHAREAESQGELRVRDNEQFEFLGDAVLGFVTSQELFRRFPDYREGELSKMRAHLVSARHLVRPARQLRVGEYLRLGRGEEKSGGRNKEALLVDALEALIAALFLDAGLDKAREFILNQILEPEFARLQEHGLEMPAHDYKSALLEIAQATGRPQPSYVLVKEEGPDHRKTFTVEARVLRQEGTEPEFAGRAAGATKKEAEQGAAREALSRLRDGIRHSTERKREKV